ncbi:hypothetical protein PIGHUM_03508 [Pigmentiphaga humi]|uniref:Polysaccharide biosynthesis protein n=1 Tax=Pigmentiphaga humi TaxID=2478468 RepID=A0A3P4B548_9BURK|nr:hypothetical protein [Pigmentiphaga humi]VCU71424.1 hypothetical protein PIGHUM_03508 [Pigmentiphaga humi]
MNRKFARSLQGQAALSIFDQAWLSMLNLVLGLVLIRMASKDAYGMYSQLYVIGLFVTSVIEAVIVNPMVNVLAGRQGQAAAPVIEILRRHQGKLSTVLAIVMGIACSAVAYSTGHGSPVALGVVFTLFLKGNALREYARSVSFVAGQPARVLKMDLAYGLCAGGGLALLAVAGSLGPGGGFPIEGVFACLALANLAALAFGPRRPRDLAIDPAHYVQIVREAWKRGRLGLPGAVLAWIVNYSYLYLAAFWLGAQATAELNASRILLVPISLLVVAWSRVARPAMGNMIARDATVELRRLLRFSLLALLLLTAVYVAVLWLGLPWLQAHLLGEKYDHAGALVPIWSLYFAINAARWVGTVALMGRDRYGFMLVESVISFAVMVVALAMAMPLYGVVGALLALIVVEFLSLLMTWGIYVRA